MDRGDLCILLGSWLGWAADREAKGGESAVVRGEAPGTELRKDGSGFQRMPLPAHRIQVSLDGVGMLLINGD